MKRFRFALTIALAFFALFSSQVSAFGRFPFLKLRNPETLKPCLSSERHTQML